MRGIAFGLFCITLLWAAVGHAKPPDYILLHAGVLLAEPGRKPQQEKTVVVHDGYITQVRSGYVDAAGLALDEGETAEVVDLSGLFVMPMVR